MKEEIEKIIGEKCLDCAGTGKIFSKKIRFDEINEINPLIKKDNEEFYVCGDYIKIYKECEKCDGVGFLN